LNKQQEESANYFLRMKKMKYLPLKIKDNLILTLEKRNLAILLEKLKKISGNAMELLEKSKI